MDKTIMRLVDKYVGTPYTPGGRSIEEGLDCIGLVHAFLGELGISFPADDGANIPECWYQDDPFRLVRGLNNHARLITDGPLLPLDILVFDFGNLPRHAGLIVSHGRFIHIRKDKYVAVGSLKVWDKFFTGLVFRPPRGRGDIF